MVLINSMKTTTQKNNIAKSNSELFSSVY